MKNTKPVTRTYTVPVTRISYSSRILTVEASSAEEARRIALDEAGNYEFSEHDADYKADIDEVM